MKAFIKKNWYWVLLGFIVFSFVQEIIYSLYTGELKENRKVLYLESENEFTRASLKTSIKKYADYNELKKTLTESEVDSAKKIKDLAKKYNVKLAERDREFIEYKNQRVKKEDSREKVWSSLVNIKNDFDNYRIIDVIQQAETDKIISQFKILDKNNIIVIKELKTDNRNEQIKNIKQVKKTKKYKFLTKALGVLVLILIFSK